MLTVKKIFSFLALFYEHTGWRLPILFLLIAFGGILEVLGIVTVLPLLNVAFDETPESPISQAIVGALNHVGISATLGSLLMVILTVFVVRGVFVFLSSYFTAHIIVAAHREIQLDLTNKFNNMSYQYFTTHATGWFSNIIVVEFATSLSRVISDPPQPRL